MGYDVIPSIQKIAFECPSVSQSLRLSVRTYIRPSAHLFHSAVSIFYPVFFKLAVRVDIEKECPGIADG